MPGLPGARPRRFLSVSRASSWDRSISCLRFDPGQREAPIAQDMMGHAPLRILKRIVFKAERFALPGRSSNFPSSIARRIWSSALFIRIFYQYLCRAAAYYEFTSCSDDTKVRYDQPQQHKANLRDDSIL